MQSYDDISDMLDQVNFSESHDLDEKDMPADANLLANPKQTHSKGPDIFENPPNMSQGSLNQRFPYFDKKDLDIEFFPPFKEDSQDDNESPDRNSSAPPSPLSRNQTGDQVQNVIRHEVKKPKNYTKNILGNIAKKTIDIMFKQYKQLLTNKCKKLGIKFKQFNKYYKNLCEKIYGPQSLVGLFKIERNDAQKVKMSELFSSVFTKIVRKRYLLYSIKLGKMQHIDIYIRQKNTHLLYFDDQLQNTSKTSGA